MALIRVITTAVMVAISLSPVTMLVSLRNADLVQMGYGMITLSDNVLNIPPHVVVSIFNITSC